jgi:hypothetical protein
VPLVEVFGHLDVAPVKAKATRHLDAGMAGGGLNRYPHGASLPVLQSEAFGQADLTNPPRALISLKKRSLRVAYVESRAGTNAGLD